MAFQITGHSAVVFFNSLLNYEQFVLAINKENVKSPHHWLFVWVSAVYGPSWGESTGDWWVPLTKCQSCGKCYPTLAREFQGFRVWGKFVFWTLELTDTPTNLANQAKVGHALDQSRSVQSRGPERAHQNNEPSWRSSRTDRRLSRQFWDD